MRNIYREIIEEGNEILENGIGHLRHRTRTHKLTTPIKEYTPDALLQDLEINHEELMVDIGRGDVYK